MANVPHQIIGLVGEQKIGFWSYYEKEESLFVYQIDKLEHGITGKYFNDSHSSVWILNQDNFQKFSNTYEVVSGGWYGRNREGEWVGGRLRTLKRRFGSVQFEGVTGFCKEAVIDENENRFYIEKPRFTNRVKVEICNSKIGKLKFTCDNIAFNPSNGIYLFDKAVDQFIDATHLLDEGGLKLKE